MPYSGTWAFGMNDCSAGVGQVYGCWVFEPLALIPDPEPSNVSGLARRLALRLGVEAFRA